MRRVSSRSDTGERGAGMARRRAVVLGALFALALAGCAAGPSPPSSELAARPGALAVPPAAAAPAAPSPAPLVAAVATRPPDLQRLVGLGRADLAQRLGEPDFRRRDPPAEIWQYRTAQCVLDIFLYRESGGERVLYAETRPRAGIAMAASDCLAAIASRQTIRATGL
jgi:hypothetical protein